jgi:hypothetical protein
MTENEKSLWTQIHELQYQNSFLATRVKELEQKLEMQSSNKYVTFMFYYFILLLLSDKSLFR